MKKIAVLVLLSIMLTGCAEQESRGHYEQADKEEDSQDNNSQIDSFRVNNIEKKYVNSVNDEEITVRLTQESIPIMEVKYSIPDKRDEISAYERKITWITTEMVDYAKAKGFPLYDIVALSSDDVGRSLSASILDDDVHYWGYSRENKYEDCPDWFIDACADLVKIDFDDEWMIETVSDIKKVIDDNIDR